MPNHVEVLLVEDNVHDAEMTIRALKKVNLANNLVHVKDGEEALEFIYARGRYSNRQSGDLPRVADGEHSRWDCQRNKACTTPPMSTMPVASAS